MSKCDSRNTEWKKMCSRVQRRKNKQTINSINDGEEMDVELISDTRKTKFGDAWKNPYDGWKNWDAGEGHDKRTWKD